MLIFEQQSDEVVFTGSVLVIDDQNILIDCEHLSLSAGKTIDNASVHVHWNEFIETVKTGGKSQKNFRKRREKKR